MYLGIDIGTSVTKAAAFDGDGRLLAVQTRPTRLSTPADGWYEQDIDDVVGSVAEVVAGVAEAAGGTPRAIGLTGQGDGVWLVDEDGAAVRPAISWMDSRAAPILSDWLADGTVAKAFRRTGNTMFPGSAGPILAWLERHEPRSLDRAATAGYCKDVVMQRLTGLRATDTSDASLPFLDPHRREYDPEVLAWCGLEHRRSLLAPVAEPVPVGELTAAAARRLGLRAGITVTSGPFDLPACALGSGIVAPGDGHLIIGTTLACQVLKDTVDTEVEPNGLTLATGTPGRWLRAMPAMVGTAAVDWVLRLIGRDHQSLEALLADSPAGARGVTCLPFFSPAGERAPFLEPAARANFDRITIQTRPSDLVRATCEAVAYAARHCFEAAGLTGELAMCGGGTASPTWLRIFADVLNRPLKLAPQPETGARGAALAARRVAEPGAGLDDWTAPEGVVEPDPARAREYEERYAAYRVRVDAARAVWRETA
ncbi:MAG TPA: FGGY-family carbohydrate kinase [Stackebrandtia sp.]|jgi:sugar (pentulose or hexulose) kinase|uniref:FGGY-family carbohydrate kinase n=1 Tax=Stackebrandtia sp. TaxID=2023065 RepID=UPI002D3D923B|nr:FGGY-family carbohydrate kinase [Stackebrandtia sp.]HZE39340.1 FGGY-family carbohydrate kinase [Stackebrandtia sp.]